MASASPIVGAHDRADASVDGSGEGREVQLHGRPSVDVGTDRHAVLLLVVQRKVFDTRGDVVRLRRLDDDRRQPAYRVNTEEGGLPLICTQPVLLQPTTPYAMPARNGSSPRNSQLRPPQGTRAKLTPGPSMTVVPLPRCTKTKPQTPPMSTQGTQHLYGNTHIY